MEPTPVVPAAPVQMTRPSCAPFLKLAPNSVKCTSWQGVHSVQSGKTCRVTTSESDLTIVASVVRWLACSLITLISHNSKAKLCLKATKLSVTSNSSHHVASLVEIMVVVCIVVWTNEDNSLGDLLYIPH